MSLNFLYFINVNPAIAKNAIIAVVNPNPTPVCGNFPVAIVVSSFAVAVVLVSVAGVVEGVGVSVLELSVVFPSSFVLFGVSSVTVTVHVAFLFPSCETTVIIVDPTFFAVIKPALLIVATDSSLELHVTILLVAFVGLNVGVRVNVFPNIIVCVFGREIPSKAISGSKLSTSIYPYTFFQ